jgi:hypothetical protein
MLNVGKIRDETIDSFVKLYWNTPERHRHEVDTSLYRYLDFMCQTDDQFLHGVRRYERHKKIMEAYNGKKDYKSTC